MVHLALEVLRSVKQFRDLTSPFKHSTVSVSFCPALVLLRQKTASTEGFLRIMLSGPPLSWAAGRDVDVASGAPSIVYTAVEME